MADEKEIKFEDALARLEGVVDRLESGELPLEESLRLFEEGVHLTKVCTHRLEEAERRITILLKDERGEVLESPFDEGQG
ncbi:MAG: exodeoxyribonuclease VII small subunit [candidate division NC10 bacterium]|jgi:exodeoxyribonuclease VII small subunit|nr:exodeoxyribonuclease VII small subunit [candidate division NC10 bacterium]MCH7897323.1 exodeoxyribonuclease VII small subunit [candidate division NC10 bacterium]MCZ6551930.1 exodeoxyribonuclease VII small subunit [candidate division NC10 bacterium]